MPAPNIPLELLLAIARHIRDDHGELRFGDFNSFLQVNRALYACLNRVLWKEAGEHEVRAQRVFTHLIDTYNLPGVELFLELGADVEVGLPAFGIRGLHDGEPTPLLVAADLDDVPLARLLLEKGAQVNYFGRSPPLMRRLDNHNFSPMHAARSAEMVQLLLDHDADPDFHSDMDDRPLHWYAIRDDTAAMRAILQHGVEVNPIGPFRETPLHTSVQRSLDSVELLVKHGADVEQRDNHGNTPLHLASGAGETDVVKFLVERWPEGTREKNERYATPLHLAAEAGKTEVVRFLVERWPEGIWERDSILNTPLHLAARAGKTDVVRFLVDQWPEGTRATNQGRETPLHLSVAAGETDVVKLLVEQWPEGLRERDDSLNMPLHLAVAAGKSDMVKFLVAKWRGGLGTRDGHLNTPLHLAVAAGKAEVVKFLVQQRPWGVKDRDGRLNTPLHLAAQAGKTDVVRFLVERWPEGTREMDERHATPLYLAAEAGKTDVVKLLLEQWPEGRRERAEMGDFLTMLLVCAAGCGWKTEVVVLLLASWPEAIRVKNACTGDTPLHFAASARHIELVRLLVERWPEGKGALNNDGKTPLLRFEEPDEWWMPQLSEEEKEEIIALLSGPYSEVNCKGMAFS
jgi:ankyrin repeat protein